MAGVSHAGNPIASFAGLLRQLRVEARLTQEELAQKAGLSPRSISDLERGISRTARKETARLLADALAIVDPMRTAFVAAARGRAPVSEVVAARDMPASELVSPRPVLWQRSDVAAVGLYETTIGTLIDVLTAAALGDGDPTPKIWLIAVTA